MGNKLTDILYGNKVVMSMSKVSFFNFLRKIFRKNGQKSVTKFYMSIEARRKVNLDPNQAIYPLLLKTKIAKSLILTLSLHGKLTPKSASMLLASNPPDHGSAPCDQGCMEHPVISRSVSYP
jgi:hypothetical protein